MEVQMSMAALFFVGISASGAEPSACSDTPPADWVSLQEAGEGVTVDARYATADNFTGAPLPGYVRAEAWMRRDASVALVAAAASLKEHGYGLVVFDAYRPIRATEEMVAWAKRTGQPHLVSDGYIASRSGHNHGHTVDLSLIGLDGAPVEMGSSFDHFGVESHHGASVGEAAMARRVLLRTAMEKAGFVAYSKEWWHYRFPVKGTSARDVAIGCPASP